MRARTCSHAEAASEVTVMDQQRIQRRVHGRKQAEAILSLLDLPHRDVRR